MTPIPFLQAGRATQSDQVLEVVNPYTGKTTGSCYQANEASLELTLANLHTGQSEAERLSTCQRCDVLRSVAELLESQADDFCQLIVAEAGKPLQYAQAEVQRAVATFSLAADYLRSARSEVLALDLAPGLESRIGLVRRVPVGPVLAISPFNFPLNLVAHKLAPAIMAGCAFLLKPASKTPLTALRLGDLILRAEYPPSAVHIVPFPGRLGTRVVEDPRTALLSFTGSDTVGWALKARAGKKKVVLELGGDAAVIVSQDADLEAAAQACATGAFAYAGQICISIQRIVVEQAVYAEFRDRFWAAVEELLVGDPADPETVCGPMIDLENAHRAQQWIQEALDAGASALVRGAYHQEGNLLAPTVLEAVPRNVELTQNEAFAPVVELIEVPNFSAALKTVNTSRFGLQAGVFTRDEANIRRAWAELQVGGVIVNQSPTLRVDAMPYGGVKDSGSGREGTRYAYEDYTEPRVLVW